MHGYYLDTVSGVVVFVVVLASWFRFCPTRGGESSEYAFLLAKKFEIDWHPKNAQEEF